MNKRERKIAALWMAAQLVSQEAHSPTSISVPDGSSLADELGVAEEDMGGIASELHDLADALEARARKLENKS